MKGNLLKKRCSTGKVGYLEIFVLSLHYETDDK